MTSANGAPRVCGDDPLSIAHTPRKHDVLPAYAGMILATPTELMPTWCAPRVCGDDPGDGAGHAIAVECSPRMRG